jgi:hypothetical protein
VNCGARDSIAHGLGALVGVPEPFWRFGSGGLAAQSRRPLRATGQLPSWWTDPTWCTIPWTCPGCGLTTPGAPEIGELCERHGYREGDRTGREGLARSPANPRDEEEASQPDDHDEAEKVEHGHEEEAQKEADCKDEKHHKLVYRRPLPVRPTVTAEYFSLPHGVWIQADVPLLWCIPTQN